MSGGEKNETQLKSKQNATINDRTRSDNSTTSSKQSKLDADKKSPKLVKVSIPFSSFAPAASPTSVQQKVIEINRKTQKPLQTIHIEKGGCSSSSSDKKKAKPAGRSTFKSHSFKAVVSIPTTSTQSTASVSSRLHIDAARSPDPQIQKILFDVGNYKRLEQVIKIAEKSVKSNNMNAHLYSPTNGLYKSQSTKPINVSFQVKNIQQNMNNNYANVKQSSSANDLNRQKNRKIVRQVLKDLIQLYKYEHTPASPIPTPDLGTSPAVSTTSEAAPAPAQATAPAPPSIPSRKPVEIKIRKKDDKLIIKSNEPIIINTEPDSEENYETESDAAKSSASDSPPPTPATSSVTEDGSKESESKPIIHPKGELENTTTTRNDTDTPIHESELKDEKGVRKIKYLGVVDTDPDEYRRLYQNELKQTAELPEIIKKIQTPDHLIKPSDKCPNGMYELEGDLDALKYIDLDNEGLSQYRGYLTRIGILDPKKDGETRDENDSLLKIVEEIFRTMDTNNDGFVSVEDAEKILLRLNSRCGRNYGEDDLKDFFTDLDSNKDNLLDLNEFKKAFFKAKC